MVFWHKFIGHFVDASQIRQMHGMPCILLTINKSPNNNVFCANN